MIRSPARLSLLAKTLQPITTRYASAMSASKWNARQIGQLHQPDYKVYLQEASGDKPISAFHDIPYASSDRVYNMIVEIPRWSNAKLEISRTEPLNPIVPDVKKGKLRYVKHFFPYTGYICNYGAIPQTWEDASRKHHETGAVGDNDPLDVCEIGSAVSYTGEVKQIKALGVLAMIDDGETDWKIVAIDVNDPLADKLNDIADVEKHLPGYLKALREWFRDYKLADGKPENQFAFNGEYKDRKYAEDVVEECHADWAALLKDHARKAPDIAVGNVTLKDSAGYKPDLASEIPQGSIINPKAHNDDLEAWYFVRPSL